jgi:hypothetical protein
MRAILWDSKRMVPTATVPPSGTVDTAHSAATFVPPETRAARPPSPDRQDPDPPSGPSPTWTIWTTKKGETPRAREHRPLPDWRASHVSGFIKILTGF